MSYLNMNSFLEPKLPTPRCVSFENQFANNNEHFNHIEAPKLPRRNVLMIDGSSQTDREDETVFINRLIMVIGILIAVIITAAMVMSLVS